jgi:hypothetical protein
VPTGSCSVPANSPITPFNETKLFDMSKGYKGCEDYRAWANVLGQLSLQFPHLRYVNIDDFSDNLGVFSLELVSEMTSLLHHKVQSNSHSNQRGALLVPTVYYAHYLQATRLPIDGMLYYFRNDKAGTGPCDGASCPGAPCASKWPEHACLAGQCAEATTVNLRSELIDVQSALSASGKELHVGVYFSGSAAPPHYDCATPTPKYDAQALEQALQMAPPVDVSGVMVYGVQPPGEKRDVLIRVFGHFNPKCPLSSRFQFNVSLNESSTASYCCNSCAAFPAATVTAGLSVDTAGPTDWCPGQHELCCLSGACTANVSKCAPVPAPTPPPPPSVPSRQALQVR